MFRALAIAVPGALIVASVLTGPRGSQQPRAQLLNGADVPAPVLETFERSCQDCHSESTHYPWYSYVFPVSLLINSDVSSGREHLNLSRWSEYSVIRRERCLSEIANQVQDGGMPLREYTLLHPRARLSRGDVDAIFDWTQQERARLIAQTVGR